MKYRVTIEDVTREVEVRALPDGRLAVALDGEELADADVLPVPGGVSLRIGHRVFDVVVGGPAKARTMASGSARTIAEVESERSRARRKRRRGGGDAAKEVRAPMPGRILTLLVAPGDEVQAGQPLVVMEAMKMENELRAEGPGRVATVVVSEGHNVESDMLLITFE